MFCNYHSHFFFRDQCNSGISGESIHDRRSNTSSANGNARPALSPLNGSSPHNTPSQPGNKRRSSRSRTSLQHQLLLQHQQQLLGQNGRTHNVGQPGDLPPGYGKCDLQELFMFLIITGI